MGTTTPNPLVEALLETDRSGIEMHYGDQPAVLDAIRTARTQNKRGPQWIAVKLSKAGTRITRAQVETWLKREGLM